MLVFVFGSAAASAAFVSCTLFVSYVCFFVFVVGRDDAHTIGPSFCIRVCNRAPARPSWPPVLLAACGCSQKCLLCFFVLCMKVRV